MKQFDLEQGIMSCWNVISDLDTLHEELVENSFFKMDQAAKFVSGLSTIYESKFAKLFQTFEDFLKEYYRISKQLEKVQRELNDLRNEMDAVEEANEELTLADEDKTLEDLLNEQEQEEELLSFLDDNDKLEFVEEEGSLI